MCSRPHFSYWNTFRVHIFQLVFPWIIMRDAIVRIRREPTLLSADFVRISFYDRLLICYSVTVIINL